MPVTSEKIRQMELALAEARAEYERENGRRYEIIRREISEGEWERIMESLTDRQERILFGLEEPKGRGVVRPAASGGDLECPICGKKGLTKRGLALHTARLHKGASGEAQPAGGGEGSEEPSGEEEASASWSRQRR